MNTILKKIYIFFIIISCIFLLSNSTTYATNETINVNFTVPNNGNNGGGGGGGGGPANSPPKFLNVSSQVSFTVATNTWEVIDDTGIQSVVFEYGLTNNYGSNGNVTGNYQVVLSNLASSTLYFFKITAVDVDGAANNYFGTFTTTVDPNGPPPADITPPIISNLQEVVGTTDAAITWDTNELADTQLSYGLDQQNFTNNYFDPNQTLPHAVNLVNLIPATQYFYRVVATDAAGNSANSTDSFTTARDNIPPPDVTNFVLTTTSNSIILSWTNPSLIAVPDFVQVRILRKVGGPSANTADGVSVYTGNQQNFTDATVVPNTNYFYTIFSSDTSKNNSPGIFRNGSIFPPPPPLPAEICNNQIDDNNNGKTDCADAGCAAFPACLPENPPTSTPEICGNNIDDDNNGKIDCADNACAGFAACQKNNPAQIVACNNGIDDDGDKKIDHPDDPGCESATDPDEYNPAEPTVPDFVKIKLSDLVFLAGNRRIRLSPVSGKVRGLFGAVLTVGISRNALNEAPRSIILRTGDSDVHQFVFNASDTAYYADVSFSQLGESQAFLEIDYGLNQLDSVGFKLDGLPWGQVITKEGQAISGTEVTLYSGSGQTIDMGSYGQTNPLLSNANGQLGWLVPNGSYKISLKKDGYYDRQFSLSNINNNVINGQWELLAIPPKIKIDPEAPLSENIKNVAGALGEQTKALSEATVQKIQDTITNPEVKQVTEQVVAPAAITAVVAGASPFISLANVLPFLRLLFLQPLMLLGWRKREKWGLVYNSLSKLPVDLAMVRLVNAETGKILQSKVTDSKGRFIFMVGPGRYKIFAQKNNFVFPSNFLAGLDSDGKKTDIYHGEIIEVKSSSSITATIPLDPLGAVKKPTRLVWEKFGRKLQSALGVLGFLVTLVSLYISPKWYIGVLLGVHVAVFVLFRKLAVPPKIKNWGLVSDEHTKAPVSRVVARLFNSQFNKLVDMQVTDSDGKYHFIAGDAKYYVTYEHKDYHPQKTDIIDLEGKEAEVITADVSLKKQ